MRYVDPSPIDPSALLGSVAGSECGAQILFLGTVRQSQADGPVIAIDYSAYSDMADQEFDRILGEAKDQWPGARIAVRHRIGEVPLGEPSIGVAVATPHRVDAYVVSRFVVDEAKRRLPVWKKERFADGSSGWREETSSDQRPQTG